jgi:hypothetical protein
LFILGFRNFATGSFPFKERKIYGQGAGSVKDGPNWRHCAGVQAKRQAAG